jgi:hypothetical protein
VGFLRLRGFIAPGDLHISELKRIVHAARSPAKLMRMRRYPDIALSCGNNAKALACTDFGNGACKSDQPLEIAPFSALSFQLRP